MGDDGSGRRVGIVLFGVLLATAACAGHDVGMRLDATEPSSTDPAWVEPARNASPAMPADTAGGTGADGTSLSSTIAPVEMIEPVRFAAGGAFFRPISDGRWLWALEHDGEFTATDVVRLDPETGRVEASWSLPAGVERVPVYAATTDGLWVKVSPTELVLLDAERLFERARHAMDPGSWSIDLHGSAGRLWANYTLPDDRRASGQETFEGAVLVDPVLGIVDRREYLRCGVTSATDAAASWWASIDCRYQIVIAHPGRADELVAPFDAPAELVAADGVVWASFGDVGTVAVFDEATADVIAAWRPAADGRVPRVAMISPIIRAGDDVVVLLEPVEEGEPTTIVRLDALTGELIGRRTVSGHGGSLAAVGSTGFISDGDGGLATFQIDDVVGDVDAAALRAVPRGVLEPFEPRDGDDRAAAEAFETLFDRTIDFEIDRDHLEDADRLRRAYDALADAAATVFADVRIVLTTLNVSGDRADVTYGFEVAGVPAFLPRVGEIRRASDGRWMVTADTFCDLVRAAVIDCP